MSLTKLKRSIFVVVRVTLFTQKEEVIFRMWKAWSHILFFTSQNKKRVL